MPFEIVRADISKLSTYVDALVNTANPRPIIGSGTDTAIHSAAGAELLEARKQIGKILPGQAAATPAFHLNAKYVIHAVGPYWRDGLHGEEALLRQTYDSALQLALQLDCHSVAFPLMASGSYHFPKHRALDIAIEAFSEFLMQHEMQIYLVVFNKKAFRLSEQLFSDIKSYIDDHYVEELTKAEYPPQHYESARRRRFWEAYTDTEFRDSVMPEPVCSFSMPLPSLADRLAQSQETFTQALLRIIDEHNWKDSDVYNRVFMDRKLFNKIKNNPNYQPKKSTALQLAIALQLNLEETKDFIGKAGYALTPSSKFDVIVEYFIQAKNYNIMELNEALFQFEQPSISKNK